MSEEPKQRACVRCGTKFQPTEENPYYVCCQCLQDERRAWEKERILRLEAGWREICPPRFCGFEWERLPVAAQKFLGDCPEGRSLLLCGPTRAGKTWTAWQLLRRAHMAGKAVRGLTAIQFGREVAEEYGRDAGAAVRWLRGLESVDLLLIDDLGKGKFTERVEAELFGLLDHRIINLKDTIITTNMADAELRESMAEDRAVPLLARIREFYEAIEL